MQGCLPRGDGDEDRRVTATPSSALTLLAPRILNRAVIAKATVPQLKRELARERHKNTQHP